MSVIAYKMLVAAASIAMAQSKAGESMKVLDVLSGQDTQIETPVTELISDEASWHRMWMRHKGPSDGGVIVQMAEPAPAVDFKKSFVLALFAGQTANVASYELVETEPAKGDHEVIRLRPVMLPANAATLTTPYAIVLVTKTKKPIQIQVPGANDRWNTVVTLVPPKPRAEAAKGKG